MDRSRANLEPGSTREPARLEIRREGAGTLVLVISGDWQNGGALPPVSAIEKALEADRPARVRFDTSGLGQWDTVLLAHLQACREGCDSKGIEFEEASLPGGMVRMLHLAELVKEREDARPRAESAGFIERVGTLGIERFGKFHQMVTFVGEVTLSVMRMFLGRARYRWVDICEVMEATGPRALGIVALINFLVGMILAFVGAVQLQQFGASIYVADLVGIATVREMGAIMTGIILCGRTGAAFAAQLGTMKVNEEIDAFRTFGFEPVEFLVLPRVVGLVAVMPLLCVFADMIAILGGFLVAVSVLDIGILQYLDRTIAAVTLTSFLLGVVKSVCFGFLVAMAGCLRGLQCGGNAAAVGQATTSAVVTGITAIVVSDGLFAVLCNALGI